MYSSSAPVNIRNILFFLWPMTFIRELGEIPVPNLPLAMTMTLSEPLQRSSTKKETVNLKNDKNRGENSVKK